MSTKRTKKGLSLFRTKSGSENAANMSSLFCWGDVPKGSTTFSELKKDDNKSKESDGYISPTKLKISQKSSPIISVAASDNHAVCVSNEFKLFGSGDNTCGQLIPTRQQEKYVSFSPIKELPIMRNSIKVVQVSCGSDFTAYLTNNGRVYTFGGNAYGQLGHSRDRRTNFVAPRMVQGVAHEILVQVSCGDFSTYVLTKHGKVYSCGLGRNGRLGVADVNMFIKNNYMDLPNYISEMLNHQQLSDKASYLEQNKQQMTPITGPLKGCPIVSISAGSAHVLAISNSGTVYGWGSNEYGQLGIDRSHAKLPETDNDSDLGYEERDGVPVPVCLGIDNICAVAAGGGHSVFLSSNRKDLYVAGDNRVQQIGPIDIETVERIMQIEWQHYANEKEASVIKIACGNMHTALLLNSGNLLVFGEKGALKDKTPLFNVEVEQVEKSVQKVSAASVFDIACGGNMTYVLTSPDYPSLLEQGLKQQNLLTETYPIGLNETLSDKTESKELFIKLRKALFDMQTLNASFLLPEDKRRPVDEVIRKESIVEDTLESSYIDIDSMMAATSIFAKAAYNDQEKLKIRQFAAHIVAQLEMSAPNVTEADQLRAYFILAVSPLLVEISPAEHEVILVSIFKMPLKARRMFFSWIYTDVACKDVQLLLDALVKPMLNQLDSHVRRRKFTKQAVYLCKFLHCLHEICMKINDESELRADDIGFQTKAHIPSAEFYTKALDSFPDGALEEMYRKWHSVVTQGGPELNGQSQNQGLAGLFGRRIIQMNDQIEGSRRERNYSEESLKSIEYKAAPIEGKTYGLKKFGLDLIAIVDNTLEDTLSNISPDLVFFKHPFLLSATTKRRFMRIDDHNMHAMIVLHSLAQSQMHPHLVLEVRRGELIHDTFAKLREFVTSKNDMLLRRPLKIKFTGEEGLDAGGVRKEFFLLLSQNVFSPSYGNFKQIGNSGLIWFNDSVDPDLLPEKRQTVTYKEYLEASKISLSPSRSTKLQDLQIIGTIMGLAVYNDTLLDVQFPAAMYQLMLNTFDPDKLDLRKYKHFDPNGARQLEYLKTITSEEEMKDLDLTFEVTQESFGVAKEIELCEHGRTISVTLENLDDYIRQYIRFKMYSPFIEDQAKALRSGFTKVISAQHAALKLFNTDELELLLCGTPELDFKVLKENSTYEGGYNPDHQTVKWFWEILDEMEYEQRKKFLKFSTGSSRAPIGGLKNVRFKLQRAGPDSPQLPTSHTCFNTFMLPDYSSKEKMKRLMLLAIENSEGFGLQ